MGLAEKRALAEIKTKWPEWEKRINAAAGATFTFDVKWDTLVKENTAGYAVDSFEKVFVESTEKALAKVCVDQIGKEAVAESVKTIVIKNETDNTSDDNWGVFKSGTLTLDHAFANVDYVHNRVESLVALLTKAL